MKIEMQSFLITEKETIDGIDIYRSNLIEATSMIDAIKKREQEIKENAKIETVFSGKTTIVQVILGS